MSAQARHRLRAEQAHAVATAPARWRCHVPGCGLGGRPQAAGTLEAALEASTRHQRTTHPPEDPPADLDAQRARWVAAGRPPLGAFPA